MLFRSADMVEHTPVKSYVIEYREPGDGVVPGKLVGACLTDQLADGLSMIYSFYDPEHETRTGLGNFIILDHILRAERSGLPYVYLGYWVEGSARMQYKVRYRPLERLGRDGWERFDPRDQASAIDRAAAAPSRESIPALDGIGKDGVPGGQGQYRIV